MISTKVSPNRLAALFCYGNEPSARTKFVKDASPKALWLHNTPTGRVRLNTRLVSKCIWRLLISPRFIESWAVYISKRHTLYSLTTMTSLVSSAVLTISSIFSAKFSSCLRITFTFGFVTGCFATKIVQQSSKGKIDVS